MRGKAGLRVKEMHTGALRVPVKLTVAKNEKVKHRYCLFVLPVTCSFWYEDTSFNNALDDSGLT